MNIIIKKKQLIYKGNKFRCSVGKAGVTKKKKEGDLKTPKGLFKLGTIYFRKDRIGIPRCKLKKKIIKKNMAWCDDPNHKKYNTEIHSYNIDLKEYFYRTDHKYDYIISINHNYKKIPNRGSAIFIHLTNDYKPTAGCIALKKKDFQILLKLIDGKTKIKIG